MIRYDRTRQIRKSEGIPFLLSEFLYLEATILYITLLSRIGFRSRSAELPAATPPRTDFREQSCYQLEFRDHGVRNEINLPLINGVKAHPAVEAVRVSSLRRRYAFSEETSK